MSALAAFSVIVKFNFFCAAFIVALKFLRRKKAKFIHLFLTPAAKLLFGKFLVYHGNLVHLIVKARHPDLIGIVIFVLFGHKIGFTFTICRKYRSRFIKLINSKNCGYFLQIKSFVKPGAAFYRGRLFYNSRRS